MANTLMTPQNNRFIFQEAENPKALFIFAHGAGADMHHDFMEQVSALLVKKHINVLRFNFPYMIKRSEDGKRYPPDRMPKLLLSYQQQLQDIKQFTSNELPLFIGGKSMGGRVAATVVGDGYSALANVKGVICLGYPFHPQKKPEKLRLEPLQETKKPILIVQGDRDLLGNKQEISQYVISPLCQVSFLADGDHNLKPRVKSGYTHQQHIESTINQIERFIDENS
jgi:predicted alpha/beta-hydrolase family hydrolase